MEAPTQAAEPVEEKKPEAASPQQPGLSISLSSIEMELGTNKQGALTNESWGASGTRGSFGILQLGARCSETNMTNP